MITREIINKILKAILEPINQSLSMLKKIDAKLDAQAISKLRAALDALQMSQMLPESDKTTLTMALSSLNESKIYFTMLAEQVEQQQERQLTGACAIVQYITKSVRDLIGLRGGALSKTINLQLEMFNYQTLAILAQVGKLSCMAALHVANDHLTNEFRVLQDMSIDIDLEREIIIPLAKKRSLVPQKIISLSEADFMSSYGSAMSPADFEEFPDYEDDDLVDKLFDRLIEKGGILYWLDNDTLGQWVNASFRYAALKTKIMRAQDTELFLKSLGDDIRSWQ